MFKVVIPSAGLGTRVGTHTKAYNKALLTIGCKPSISHVIDKFEKDVEIIIITGYKGDLLRQVVNTLHDDRSIKFMEVENYEGPGSGLGLTLSVAKTELQCPFIFIANDTLIPSENCEFNPNNYGNWMGFYKAKTNDRLDLSQFRTVTTKDGYVTKINAKGSLNPNIYIGLCGILDYKSFWKSMESDQAVSVGESQGLKELDTIKAVEFDNWLDTGNLDTLEKAKDYYKQSNYNILEKENEAIWFVGNKVCKFHTDPNFIKDRVERTKYVDSTTIPKLTKHSDNIYVYEKIEGEILGNISCCNTVTKILDTMQLKYWSIKKNITDAKDFEVLQEFYKNKTFERVSLYFKRFETVDKQQTINGVKVDKVIENLNSIEWQNLYSTAVMARFHGDFHAENILVKNNQEFVLLDWRQNFGDNSYEFGDVYYDLAKFKHGLLVNHGIVTKNLFKINYLTENGIEININIPYSNVFNNQTFEKWCKLHDYDNDKINLLTAIIYLNIASLHEPPYAHFLFCFGSFLLQKYIDGSNTI
jgi:NDP-sugar pyrophosphorylase family protein